MNSRLYYWNFTHNGYKQTYVGLCQKYEDKRWYCLGPNGFVVKLKLTDYWEL